MTTNGFVLHDITTATPVAAAILDATERGWGFMPNLHRVLAESPAALEAYDVLWMIAEKTSFTPVERSIVYLTLCYEDECSYCMAGHSTLSFSAKVDPTDIAAVRNGEPVADAKLETLRKFVATVMRKHGFVSEASVAVFKAAGYDNRAMLEILVLAATKLISNYTNHFADTPLDEPLAVAEWTPPYKLAHA
jgi:alkylhydroperoxidase family enzyme